MRVNRGQLYLLLTFAPVYFELIEFILHSGSFWIFISNSFGIICKLEYWRRYEWKHAQPSPFYPLPFTFYLACPSPDSHTCEQNIRENSFLSITTLLFPFVVVCVTLVYNRHNMSHVSSILQVCQIRQLFLSYLMTFIGGSAVCYWFNCLIIWHKSCSHWRARWADEISMRTNLPTTLRRADSV